MSLTLTTPRQDRLDRRFFRSRQVRDARARQRMYMALCRGRLLIDRGATDYPNRLSKYFSGDIGFCWDVTMSQA